MKRLLSTLLVVFISVGIYAYDFEVDNMQYTILSYVDKTAEISKGDLNAKCVVIPETVKQGEIEYTVTTIGEEAFAEDRVVEEITIPKTIKYINFAAFQNVYTIKRVNITDLAAWCSIIYDNWYTIYADYRDWACPLALGWEGDIYLNGQLLTDAVIPETVTAIQPYAFHGCKSLKSVVLPNSVKSIGRETFENCLNLETIDFGESLESIDTWALRYCKSLKTLHFPKTLNYYSPETTLGAQIEGIEVDSENPYYDSRDDCNAIIDTKYNMIRSGCRNTKIPEGVIGIGRYSFFGCEGIKSIIVPLSVEYIGDYAFDDCYDLDTLTIPNIKQMKYFADHISPSVINMQFADEADYYNYLSRTDLLSVFHQQGLTLGVHRYFIGGKLLTDVKNLPDSITEVNQCAFRNCADIKSVVLGNSITSINYEAFDGCTGLESITIPASMAKAYYYSFRDCTALNRVNISDLKAWCNIEFEMEEANPLFNGADMYLNGGKIVDLVIPEGVTSIRDSQFAHCNSFVTLTLPDCVTNVGSATFKECKNLQTINFSHTMTAINEETFAGCESLKSIHIPNNITSINSKAFAYCSGLTDADTGDGVNSVSDAAFGYGGGKLTSFTFGISVKNIGMWALLSNENLTSITCKGTTPPSAEDTFVDENVYGNATLYVPSNAINNYKKAYPWSRFSKIQHIGTNGISTPTIDLNSLHIYDLLGRRLRSANKGITIIDGQKYLQK